MLKTIKLKKSNCFYIKTYLHKSHEEKSLKPLTHWTEPPRLTAEKFDLTDSSEFIRVKSIAVIHPSLLS